MGIDCGVRWAAGVLVGALALACGNDDDSKPDGAAGSAQGGNGGSGTGSGGSGAPATTPLCDAMEARVSVAGGMSLTIPLVQAANISSANDNTEKWSWGTAIGNYGLFKMVGTGAIAGQLGQPLDGATLSVDHALFAPNIGDSLGTMFGVAPGSGSVLRRENGQVVVDLKSVATLQGCGDFPAMGELHLCYNAGDDCPDFDRGVLDNYRWEDDISSWSPTGSDLRASVGSQGANLRARLDANGTAIAWAHFGTSLYGRYEGKTLCAGAGSELSTMTIDDTSYTVVHLRNLAWLEGPGTGQISGCLR